MFDWQGNFCEYYPHHTIAEIGSHEQIKSSYKKNEKKYISILQWLQIPYVKNVDPNIPKMLLTILVAEISKIPGKNNYQRSVRWK